MATKKETTPYLTKRHVKSASRKGFEEASRRTMETAGSVVVVEGDWVVRKHSDGSVEKIEKLNKAPKARVKASVKKLAFT